MTHWVATICLPLKHRAQKKNVAPVAPVAMAALVVVTAMTVVLVLAVVAHAALRVPMPPLLMAATNLPVPVALMPLSAFVKQTRPLQQRTEKENKRCCNLLAANSARNKKAAILVSLPEVTRWRSVISVSSALTVAA